LAFLTHNTASKAKNDQNLAFLTQNTASICKKLTKKRLFFCRKLRTIAENCGHNMELKTATMPTPKTASSR
jgi:hypothetical protein